MVENQVFGRAEGGARTNEISVETEQKENQSKCAVDIRYMRPGMSPVVLMCCQQAITGKMRGMEDAL
ncbi:MAG: hypothetical protein ACLTPG_00970 [Mediterraneibacter gnavus]